MSECQCEGRRTAIHPGAVWLMLIATLTANGVALGEETPDYAKRVRPILIKYCVGCHNTTDAESGLRMHTLAALRNGGDSGPAIAPPSLEDSLIWQRMSGAVEPKMPPSDMPQPTASELDVVRAWIAGGAPGKDTDVSLAERIPAKSHSEHSKSARAVPESSLRGITAALPLPTRDLLLLGRFGAVDAVRGQWRYQLDFPVIGKVTQMRRSPDGRSVVIASGVPGLGGRVSILDAESLGAAQLPPRVLRTVEGHSDIVYSAVLSPNGRTLATAGYDRAIHLWDANTGEHLRSLLGHNGAVYDLDFDPSGRVLASASADETIKLWNVATGERLDTLGQPEAEQYVVRFDASGEHVIAAGADRRIRVWKLLSKDQPTVSPMLAAIFAHEAAIVQMAWSRDGKWLASAAEDRTLKLWRVRDWQPMGIVASLDDVASSLDWSADGESLSTTDLSGDVRQVRVPAAMKRLDEPATQSEPTLEASHPASTAESIKILESDAGPRTAEHAQLVPAPCSIVGKLLESDMRPSSDRGTAQVGDWYAFDSRKGEEWMIAIDAAKSGSPLDSWLDVTDAQGHALLRTRLQAVRESYFTFRGKDSTNIDDFRLHRWEDMELNEYLYAAGEVVRLWLYPRGPDSGFKVYPGTGARHTYFGTSAATHALNEPAWIVRELAADAEPVSNGLPVFPIYYSNDDDPERRRGKDSAIHFQAPADGRYWIRVRDARGQSGDAYQYTLSIAAPNPQLALRVETPELVLRPGGGNEFAIAIDRWDGLRSSVEVSVEGLPEGVRCEAPLRFEANQFRAVGQLSLASGADESIPKEFELVLRATSQHRGRAIEAPVGKLKVKVQPKPTMPLKLVGRDDPSDASPIRELRIRPGQTISAKLVIERRENAGDIAFGGDDSGRNLPHGCFVSNIGLSGLLIPAGQSEREVFITASPVVQPQQRWFHLRAQVDGNPTTLPVLLIVE
ncbi:MAG: c-type cytochrome domain-containing protein [Pirellula sp.]